MYYIATVAFSTGVVDKEGRDKMSKTKMPVRADSVEEAIINIANYHKGVTYSYSVEDIKKFPIECVIDPANTPEIYQTK